MIAEERKAILLEYERLVHASSDLYQHWHNAKPELNLQRIDAIKTASNYAIIHSISTGELTNLKRAGRPVCTTKKQAFEQMNNFFGAKS